MPNRKSVVLVSHKPEDYEPLISVARFLRFYNVSNPIYLQLEGYSVETYQGFLGMLTKILQNVSTQGNETFRPISELPSESELLGVGFSDKPARISCVGEFPCWR